ncbi:MAG: 1-deoxy-D-xylulose-5-phosphate reductoisomerase [Chitinivibrionia bacterium]|nr:1-deoxy-D-xylulose-5-phosphate reductoisomerase [Chitinivibrionia bacterium]
MKRIVVLGSTGSVGTNTLEVAAHHGDEFDVVGFSAGSNVPLLERQRGRFPDALFAVGNRESMMLLAPADPTHRGRCVGFGEDGIRRLIDEARPDLLVNCLVGFIGLKPTLEALESGVPVAMANKESIVAGGEILVAASRRSGAGIIPIDSEHVAISQCLAGHSVADVRRVYITASGGSLRDKPIHELAAANIEEVLSHPTWKMGDKITVDSATMLNKGLEVIEAHWLFDVPYERIEVLIHPQSTVHSLVEFKNGSIIAQMSIPDMKLPILHALSYPRMIATDLAPSTIAEFPPLCFERVDASRYPCLGLAFEAARAGGNRPAVLNSANEEAVSYFLDGAVSFADIHSIVRYALDEVPYRNLSSLEDIIDTDREARERIRNKYCLQ